VTKPSIERALEVIGTLREPTRRRLYDYVERQPRAVSRDEAAQAVGISRALAAFHLEKLVSAGILRPEYRRLSGRTGPGAGRTSKLYRRSNRELELSLPHRDHELLARLLADAFASGTSPDADAGPARDYGQALGTRARRRVRGRPSDDRLTKCVQDIVESIGFDPFRAGREIRLRNCPFDPLSRVYSPVVCSLAQSMLKGILDGVGTERLRVGREESSDLCCGVLGPDPPMNAPGPSPATTRLQGRR
jgi:predicted ArsR family transcriptional regulator